MPKASKIVDQWLIIAIGILMVAALLLLGRVLRNTEKRETQLDQAMVNQTLESQQYMIKLLASSFEQRIKEESDRLAGEPMAGTSEPPSTWLGLMSNQAAIRSIGLADDQGNEWVLLRSGDLWRYRLTRRDGENAVAYTSTWSVEQGRISAPDTMFTDRDPRSEPWYRQALEEHFLAAAWSYGPAGDEQHLFLSHLTVDPDDTHLYILRFSLDPGTLLSEETSWSRMHSMIFLTPTWQPLIPIDTSDRGRAWTAILANLQKTHSTEPFETTVAGKQWVGRLVPLHLHGMKLYTGVLISKYKARQWSRDRWVGLWSFVGLMLLLGIFITLALSQSTNANRRAHRESRRSHIQAQHLAETIVQREILDREVHHRVKNNLQVVSSLLNLHAQRIPDQAVHKEFIRGKRRIDSMALVHHKLYKHKDLSAVDLQQFIEDIAVAIAAMYTSDGGTVSHSIITRGVKCNADTAIQLGMLLCELLANCHQHAFPYATGGHIDITVEDRGEGGYALVVKDNGKGFDPTTVDDSRLGLEVVEALAEQLDGSISISTDAGTRVEVLFRSIGKD